MHEGLVVEEGDEGHRAAVAIGALGEGERKVGVGGARAGDSVGLDAM